MTRTGRAAVAQHQDRLDAVFERVDQLPEDAEIRSDFARYLCVLVSGFLETALFELMVEHARQRGAPSLQRFVESKMKRFTNAKSHKILDLLGTFDSSWRVSADEFLQDELKSAVDSVVDLRNNIAHGRSTGITYDRVSKYYKSVKRVVGKIADLVAP